MLYQNWVDHCLPALSLTKTPLLMLLRHDWCDSRCWRCHLMTSLFWWAVDLTIALNSLSLLSLCLGQYFLWMLFGDRDDWALCSLVGWVAVWSSPRSTLSPSSDILVLIRLALRLSCWKRKPWQQGSVIGQDVILTKSQVMVDQLGD